MSTAECVREGAVSWHTQTVLVVVVFGRGTQILWGGTCKHQFYHSSASSNWTSLLNMERRRNMSWIVLQVEEAKPTVKLVKQGSFGK